MARRKQTADDFPKTLLYSMPKVWVKPGPDRTARIGYALPALADPPPNVYFIDLQHKGYIVQGKPFGAIDLDTGRLELLAPFSARIERVNWDVMDDPLFLMADPFGDGWLYDVGKVPMGVWSKLLDRDRFFAFLEFERLARRLGLKPVLGAEATVEKDVPWPDDVRVTFGGMVILSGRVVRLGRNQTFTPQWTRGTCWRVETRFQQPSLARLPEELAPPNERVVLWRYEVVDTEGAVEATPCCVVKVTEVEGPPPQSYFLLHIAKDDFTLRLIEEVSVFDGTRLYRTPNDWGPDSYMELRQPRELLLDLPMFPVENLEETREVEAKGEPVIRQHARFPDPETMEIACEATVAGRTLRTVQAWRRGLPWWQEAERTSGARVMMKARLVAEEESAEVLAGAALAATEEQGQE